MYILQVFKNLTTEMLSKDQPKEAYEVAMAMQSQLELTYTSDAARYLEDLKQFIAMWVHNTMCDNSTCFWVFFSWENSKFTEFYQFRHEIYYIFHH